LTAIRGDWITFARPGTAGPARERRRLVTRPNILVTIESPLYGEITTPEARAKLKALAGRLTLNETDSPWSADDVADRIGDADAVLGSWRSCRYDQRLLDAAPNLKIICYAAGSIRNVTPPAVFNRGVRVAHAARLIAESVAEFTLAVVLDVLRRTPELFEGMRRGGWREIPIRGQRGLYGKRYGIVGASMVGRRLIGLLKPFSPEILVYDPYLSEEQARALSVRRVDLMELMSTCDVISLHAPSTPETKGMIGAEQFRSIKDDAVFVNNARAWLVDSAAMLKELKKERFYAALDVFDQEPLPDDHPLRKLRRTVLSPHTAGNTVESRAMLASAMIDELERFFSGAELRFEVKREQLGTMA